MLFLTTFPWFVFPSVISVMFLMLILTADDSNELSKTISPSTWNWSPLFSSNTNSYNSTTKPPKHISSISIPSAPLQPDNLSCSSPPFSLIWYWSYQKQQLSDYFHESNKIYSICSKEGSSIIAIHYLSAHRATSIRLLYRIFHSLKHFLTPFYLKHIV